MGGPKEASRVSPCSRIVTAVRVSWSASVSFASFGTTLTALVALPLFDVLFATGMGRALASDDILRAAFSSAVASVALGVAGGVVNAVVAAHGRGVLALVLTARRFDPIFWIAVGVAPIATSLITGLVTIGGIALFTGTIGSTMAADAAVLGLVALVIGWLLGLFAAGISIIATNPYLGATILSATFPVLIGVIVPTSLYPEWLVAPSLVTPLARSLSCLGYGVPAGTMIVDLALAGAWAFVGLAWTRMAVARMRRGYGHLLP